MVRKQALGDNSLESLSWLWALPAVTFRALAGLLAASPKLAVPPLSEAPRAFVEFFLQQPLQIQFLLWEDVPGSLNSATSDQMLPL